MAHDGFDHNGTASLRRSMSSHGLRLVTKRAAPACEPAKSPCRSGERQPEPSSIAQAASQEAVTASAGPLARGAVERAGGWGS